MKIKYELLKNEAKMIIDEDGFSHFKLELKDYLTLDEKIKLQNARRFTQKLPDFLLEHGKSLH